MKDDPRIVHVWKNYEGWIKVLFDNLKPGMIAMFDCNSNYICTVTSYPFLSKKYSPYPKEAVLTIICDESLYYYENN